MATTFSRQPIIEKILNRKAHYIFTAKPADHKCLMGWLANQPSLEEKKFIDEKGQCHHYEWLNDVPLNGHANSIRVNFFLQLVPADGDLRALPPKYIGLGADPSSLFREPGDIHRTHPYALWASSFGLAGIHLIQN